MRSVLEIWSIVCKFGGFGDYNELAHHYKEHVHNGTKLLISWQPGNKARRGVRARGSLQRHVSSDLSPNRFHFPKIPVAPSFVK